MKAVNTILLILLFSCNQQNENNKIVNLDSDQIQLGEIVHDTLSAEQIIKIKHIQSTFQEVYPTTLDETISNFKRDQNPYNEIAI